MIAMDESHERVRTTFCHSGALARFLLDPRSGRARFRKADQHYSWISLAQPGACPFSEWRQYEREISVNHKMIIKKFSTAFTRNVNGKSDHVTTFSRHFLTFVGCA